MDGKFEQFLKTDSKAQKWVSIFSAPPKLQQDFFAPPLYRVIYSPYYTPSKDNIRLFWYNIDYTT